MQKRFSTVPLERKKRNDVDVIIMAYYIAMFKDKFQASLSFDKQKKKFTTVVSFAYQSGPLKFDKLVFLDSKIS